MVALTLLANVAFVYVDVALPISNDDPVNPKPVVVVVPILNVPLFDVVKTNDN